MTSFYIFKNNLYSVDLGCVFTVCVCVCVYVCVCVGGGGGGGALGACHAYESASKAFRDHHNHARLWPLESNSGNLSHGRFLEPLPFSFAFEVLPQNCLLGAADLSALCLQ